MDVKIDEKGWGGGCLRAIPHQEYEGTSRGAPSIDRNVRYPFSSRKKVKQKPRCERRRETSGKDN